MNNLADLRAERKKLQLKEEALKQILVNQTQSAISQSKQQIVDRINQFNSWGQLGLSALAIYQTFARTDQSEQSIPAAASSDYGQLSDWLSLASDVAKVVE